MYDPKNDANPFALQESIPTTDVSKKIVHILLKKKAEKLFDVGNVQYVHKKSSNFFRN